MIQAVIFDIDNTLYDYDAAHAVAFQALTEYAQHTLGVDPEEFEALHQRANQLLQARTGGDCAAIHNRLLRYQILLEELGKPILHAPVMERLYWNTLIDAAVPSPGALVCLEQLRQAGPQMIMAGASCDDIFVIVLFSTFVSMAQGGSARVLDFVNIPISKILSAIDIVVVPYRNSDGGTQFHLATRLLEADAFLDDFHSAGNCPLAWLKDDKIVCNPAPCVPAQSLLQEKCTPVFKETVRFSKKILPLKMYPGLDFTAISPNAETCAAVLLLGYHSGTAPQKAVEAFAERCFEASVPVYLAPVKRGEDMYASADTLFKGKVVPLYNMTPESALAKLKIAYNHPTKTAAEVLKETLYFEDTGVFAPQQG